MNANMQHRINTSVLTLVRLSAPTLRDEYTPLRPPMKPATATIAECLAVKRKN